LSSGSKSIIVDTYCPGCKKDHPTAIPLDDLNVAIGKVQRDEPRVNTEYEAMTGKIAELEKIVKEKREAPASPAVEKPKKATIRAPPHIKKGKCKNCGELHPNELYEGPPRGRCDTCGAIFPNKKGGKCPFCHDGEIDELSDEEVEEMKLYSESEDEDEHDHEHE
jgi:hypothetical protein